MKLTTGRLTGMWTTENKSKTVPSFSVIKQGLPFQNNPKNLDPSYKVVLEGAPQSYSRINKTYRIRPN